MKYFTGLLVLFLFLSSSSQKYDKEITGELNQKIFRQDVELKQWFLKEYNTYHVADSLHTKLKLFLTGKKIVVVLGTWCSDSQREFPRLIKILEAVHFPMKNLKIFGVDRDKKSPKEIVSSYHITNVPAIIVFNRNKTEAGRIVEETKVSLEYDLLHF